MSNLSVGIVKQRHRWMIAAAVLSILLGIAGTVRWRHANRKITAQQLLREALSEEQKSGATGPSLEIFEQQATQGYYDDALVTAHLSTKKDDLYWYLVELARIRTENGDLQSAKNMINMFVDPAFQTRMMKGIALVQAGKGDLAGALETGAPLADSNDVLVEFAQYQIKRGELEGALKTAERLTPASAYQVFYEIGDALRLRHEQNRVHKLSAGMSNRKLARLFLRLVPLTLWDQRPAYSLQMNDCEMAGIAAMEHRLAEARKALENTRCWRSFVAIQYYAIDPIDAEKLLRSTTDPKDMAFGLSSLAMAAAKKERIEDALRFDNEGRKMEGSSRYSATVEIARAWTIRDGPANVLSWARSQPTSAERELALIGMAQALGHARPQQ